MAASNQGDCARLLSGNEPGSIRGCQPVWGCRPAARTPVSKTGNVGATPATLANSCREPASAGTCLQNRRSGCDPLAALQFDGGRGELVNTARCDRVMTGSIPVDHPSPVSTMAMQPPCKRSTKVRSLRWAPVLAGSFNGRTRRSERRNLGSIPWPASILAGGPGGYRGL